MFSDTKLWEGEHAPSSSRQVPFIFASIISPSWAAELKWEKKKKQCDSRNKSGDAGKRNEGF